MRRKTNMDWSKVKEWLVRKDWLVPNWVWVVGGVVALGVLF